MVAMLTGGQTGHKQGPLRPNKIKQTKQKQERGRSKPERAKENPNDRRAKIHITAHQFCNLNEQEKTKIAQGKRTASRENYLRLNTNVRQRKERKKSTRTAKRHSRNHSKKTSNENNNTVCVHKNATRQKKTQGKNKTTAKNYF